MSWTTRSFNLCEKQIVICRQRSRFVLSVRNLIHRIFRIQKKAFFEYLKNPKYRPDENYVERGGI